MADKIRNLQNRIKSKIQNGDEFLAIVSYFPLIGWIIVQFKDQKKDKLVQFHSKQAKEINIYIVVLFFIIWLLENFPFTRWLFGKDKFFYPIIESIWLMGLILYIIISLIGIYKALNDEIWSFPYREEIKEKLKEFTKKIQN